VAVAAPPVGLPAGSVVPGIDGEHPGPPGLELSLLFIRAAFLTLGCGSGYGRGTAKNSRV
jgi:hypothetical protein